MTQAQFAVNFFIALFALVDPIGNVPLFAAATAGASTAGRRLTAVYISLFAFLFLAFFFLTGLSLLRFFGISMAAFRIAGGLLLVLMGLSMVREDAGKAFSDPGEAVDSLPTRAYAAARFEGLVVPFGMPLLIGPGAISSAVIYAEEAHQLGFGAVAVGVVVIAAQALAILASFWMTGLISKALGKIGMMIVVRVLGLILCAMGVQFMLAGLAGSTIDLIRKDTAHPYQSTSAPSARGRPRAEISPRTHYGTHSGTHSAAVAWAGGHQRHAPFIG